MDNFWDIPNWERDDRHFQQLAAMPFRRPVPFIPKEKGLYVVRGPRQVGKSSWLKEVLSYHSKTEQCYYLSCEKIQDFRELAALLESIANRKVVLLDEISFVPNWDRAIKHIIDSGKSNILMVTGSHAHDLKLGSDRLPGRFDGGGEFELLPMDFFEFQAMRKQAGWRQIDFLEELRVYFKVGGFPTAVAEGGEEGKIPKQSIETYWKWLSGDIAKLGKQESYLTELLIKIAEITQSATSLQNLATKTGIGSHNTVLDYLSILESCFALRTLYAVDIDEGSFQRRKNRKLYFADPLLYWLALEIGGISPPKNWEQQLSEQVAHEYLSRREKRFGYFANKNGEVDFVKPRQWAIEVKWSPVALDISKTFFNLIVPWKSIWTHGNYLLEIPPSSRVDL